MYTLIEVTTRQHETDFLELPVRLYKGNPWWIRPLDNDIRNVFDPAKNPCFQNGECIRWILKNIWHSQQRMRTRQSSRRESSCFYQSENLSSGQI